MLFFVLFFHVLKVNLLRWHVAVVVVSIKIRAEQNRVVLERKKEEENKRERKKKEKEKRRIERSSHAQLFAFLPPSKEETSKSSSDPESARAFNKKIFLVCFRFSFFKLFKVGS